MVLGEITIKNSVRYVPKKEQTREIKQNTTKNNTPPKKQTKNYSQNNKKFLKNVAAQGFTYLE